MECAMKKPWHAPGSVVKAPEEQDIKQNCRSGISQVRAFAPLSLRSPGIDCNPRRKPAKDLQPIRPSSEVHYIHGRARRGSILIVAAGGLRK
jgi:hypothetical protein